MRFSAGRPLWENPRTMSSPADEARQLRVLLAQVVAGLDVESETGELVDFMDYPVIDFGRDSVETIREKLLQRQVYGAMRGDGVD